MDLVKIALGRRYLLVASTWAITAPRIHHFLKSWPKMLLYAITGRRLLPGGEPEQQAALVDLAAEWARAGVDYIQVREKDLAARDLLGLAQQIVTAVRAEGGGTKVLVNGPPCVALEAGAD